MRMLVEEDYPIELIVISTDPPPGGRGRGAVDDAMRMLVEEDYPIELIVISTDPSVFLTSIDSFAFGNSTVR